MISDNMAGKLIVKLLMQNNKKRMKAIIQSESKKSRINAKEKQDLIAEFHDTLGVCTDTILSKGILKAGKKGLEKQRNLAVKRLDYTVKEVVENTKISSEEAKRKILETVRKFDVSLKQYRRNKLYLLSDKEIYEFLGREAKEKLEICRKTHSESGIGYRALLKQMNRVKEKHGISYAEFALYRCWKMNDKELTEVARLEDSRKIMRKGRTPGSWVILANKLLFNEKYGDMLGRKYWTNQSNNTFEEFLEFTDGLDEIFVKFLKATQGKGAQRITLKDKELKELYDSLMKMDLVLVEECVNQHEAIEEFRPGCVNTIRLVTFLADGEEEFIYTAMRFGHNGFVDNIHADGMACAVNTETGTIESPAINLKGEVFEKHPVSGKQFEGFQIPYWNEVIDLVKRAMHINENIRYIGWDVAVSKTGPVLIEGNGFPDPMLIQAPLITKNRRERYRYLKYLAPTIKEQPQNAAGRIDTTVKTGVTADGVGLTYQWEYSDDNGETWKKSKANKAEYISTVTQERNGRLVRCIVSDYGNDQAVSEAARITVIK